MGVEKLKKCKHGRFFCCECSYGKISEQEVYSWDAVDDIQRSGAGHKLEKSHFGIEESFTGKNRKSIRKGRYAKKLYR